MSNTWWVKVDVPWVYTLLQQGSLFQISFLTLSLHEDLHFIPSEILLIEQFSTTTTLVNFREIFSRHFNYCLHPDQDLKESVSGLGMKFGGRRLNPGSVIQDHKEKKYLKVRRNGCRVMESKRHQKLSPGPCPLCESTGIFSWKWSTVLLASDSPL